MNFRPTPDEEPEINLIPLIDVLLMTLIFLIVTTSFSSQALLQVRLPEASIDPAPAPDALRVVIDARGRPLQFPSDSVRRRELMKRWSYAVGG